MHAVRRSCAYSTKYSHFLLFTYSHAICIDLVLDSLIISTPSGQIYFRPSSVLSQNMVYTRHYTRWYFLFILFLLSDQKSRTRAAQWLFHAPHHRGKSEPVLERLWSLDTAVWSTCCASILYVSVSWIQLSQTPSTRPCVWVLQYESRLSRRNHHVVHLFPLIIERHVFSRWEQKQWQLLSIWKSSPAF